MNATNDPEQERSMTVSAKDAVDGHLRCWPRQAPKDPARVAEVLSDAMRGIPYTTERGPVPLGPMAIGRDKLDELLDAAINLSSLIERICWSLTKDPWELAKLTRLQLSLVPFLGASGNEHEKQFSGCNVRPDAVLVNGTPKFLEFNFGAANSGPQSSHVLNTTYAKIYGPLPLPSPGRAAGMLEARANFYREVINERSLDHSVALLGTTREIDLKDARYFEVEPAYLRSVGIDSAFVEPEQLARGYRQWGLVQKHFLPEEWVRQGIPLSSIYEAHGRSTFFVSDSGLSLSSKLIMAWLSSGAVQLTSHEERLVAQYVPWTRELVRGPVEYHGCEYSLLDLALTRQQYLVLKPANDCGGRGVVLGRSISPAKWEIEVYRALRNGPHVLQEYMKSDSAMMTYWDKQTASCLEFPVDYVLGPYIVNGTGAGCTVRHAPLVPNGVVNHAQGATLNTVVPLDSVYV